MSEQEYSQFLFEKHDQKKFDLYKEFDDSKAFTLPNDKNQRIYLFDEDGGWCDFNGCYYNSQGQPSGWIILSKDGKKYMKFNLNTEFVEEQHNIYYSTQSFDATRLEINLQKLNIRNEQQKEKQRFKQENQKQYYQKNQEFQQKQNKYKDQENEKTKAKEKEHQYFEKVDEQLPKEINNTKNDIQTNEKEVQQRKQRDRKQNDRNYKKEKKNDKQQDNNESKKYYILNINENSLSKEDFFKYLVEECKIQEDRIIDFNDNILKLADDKDAIKLYRLNKKQQTDKVQKFIVST